MAKQTFTTGQVLTAAQMTSLQQTAMGGGSTTAKVASYVLVAADAGTVVQMNAAGSTTITVNTALFAAGDSVQIQNVGAGACTITAGTATVSTSATLILKQYDAGTLYFNSTSAAIFFASDAADSPLTTKGDLYTYSTTNDRLAVGNNGESIYADSAATTGLRYSATPSASNPILNSAFQIAQRGTSFTAGGFCLDRWYMNGATNMTVSRQTTSDTTNLPFIQYCARIARTAASTSTTTREITQSLESVNAIPFAGKTVTVSFYARAGANYSATSNALGFTLISGTGTDQNRGTGAYTGEAYPATVTATLTTTWQRFTATGTVAATATELAIYITSVPTGTAGANDYYEITGVQIDIGSVALPFRTYAATIQSELAACQRYLPAIFTNAASEIGTGYNLSTTQPFLFISFQVPARVAPTGITATAANYSVRNTTGSTITLTAIAYNNASVVGAALLGTVASGLVAGQGTTVQLNGTLLFTGCEL